MRAVPAGETSAVKVGLALPRVKVTSRLRRGGNGRTRANRTSRAGLSWQRTIRPARSGSDFDVSAVRESYRSAAVRVSGEFYPAGTAWQEAWARDASLVLYEADGLHPSATGSFLAALVMYEKLTGKDARALPAQAYADGGPLTLSASTIRLLQEAAHAANARGTAP